MESDSPPVIPGERPLLAFISSVMAPALDQARREVVSTLDKVPYLTRWAFEFTPGGSEPVDKSYLRHVREADIVVWLVSAVTTEPVENEVREALAADRRLWVVILVEDGRDARTEALLSAVGLKAKWIEPSRAGGISHALELTLEDEIVRALRGIPGMSRIARLEELIRASYARCIVRWQAAGLARELATTLAHDMTVGEPLAEAIPCVGKQLKVLTGEVGAGKSLISERLFQIALSRFRDDAGAPVPVYLDAREARGSLKERIIEGSDGLANPRVQGVFVVIDGADEVGIGAATDLLNEARTLSTTWPNSFFILTSRPLPGIANVEESLSIPMLSKEESESIVARVLGTSLRLDTYWRWPDSVKDAIRRPLFAILIGLYLREHNMRSPRSNAQLMDNLVKRVLGDFDITPARNLLCSLAVASINREGARVPSGEVADVVQLRRLMETRLIIEERGTIGFSLPILTEWFAAQAIGIGLISMTDLLCLPGYIDRWRYPLVIALGSFDHDTVMNIMRPIAISDPAFAGEIVNEGLARWGLNEDIMPPAPLDAGVRVRDAMQAWVTGIGPLSSLIAPLRQDGSLCSLGVQTSSAWLATSWYRGDDILPDISLLPTGSDILSRESGWYKIRSARPGQQPAWAWRWTLEELVNDLRNVLRNRYIPLDGGALVEEDIWYSALAVTNRGKLNHKPIPLSELETKLQRWNDVEILHLNNVRRNLQLLRSRIVSLRNEGRTELTTPYPGPDLERGGRWVWSPYSHERLLQRTISVITAALQGYGAIVRHWFPALSNRLRTAVILPAVFEGDFVPPEEHGDGSVLSPGLNWRLRPLPLGVETSVDIRLGSNRVRESIRDWLEQGAMFRSLRPAASSWIGPTAGSSTLYLFGEAPAREIAYNWLNDDLIRIAWSTGSIGRSY